MGRRVEHECDACGAHFMVDTGGGFFFDLLHRERCGAARAVAHEDMGDVHLAYLKGLDGPYAVACAVFDAHVRETYRGDPLTREGYEAAVEDTLAPCACGGRFRHQAPPRCPGCGALSEAWSRGTGEVSYD